MWRHQTHETHIYMPSCLPDCSCGVQADGAAFQQISEAGSAIMWEQQRDRLVKHLSRAQTRAALRRVCVTIFKCCNISIANYSKM